MKGAIKLEHSFTDLAKVETTMPIETKRSNVVTTKAPMKAIMPAVRAKLSPCIKFGSDNAKPKKAVMPLAKETTEIAKILPMASSPRLIGVRSIADKVPLSFSPATASGQIETTEEKSKLIVAIGRRTDISFAPKKSLEPTFGVMGFPSLPMFTK